jgi:hypothetical protein
MGIVATTRPGSSSTNSTPRSFVTPPLLNTDSNSLRPKPCSSFARDNKPFPSVYPHSRTPATPASFLTVAQEKNERGDVNDPSAGGPAREDVQARKWWRISPKATRHT